MRNARIALIGVALVAVSGTGLAGFLLNHAAALTVAVAGVCAVVLVSGYVQTKALQLANQRLSGLAKVVRSSGQSPSGSAELERTAEMALEELRLAARSVTVPQAHFDQLLRTISANTVRTELALSEAVDDIRELSADGKSH